MWINEPAAVKELSYLNQVQKLVEGRQHELLKPEGLRDNNFAGWPFKLAKLVDKLTSPNQIATNFQYIYKTKEDDAKASTETKKEIIQQPRPLEPGKKRVPRGKRWLSRILPMQPLQELVP